MTTGGCHCKAIRYEMTGEPIYHMLCHCTDCRKSAGAPAVSWALMPTDQLKVTAGEPVWYSSSEHGRRSFCGRCGTGLFYTNDVVFAGKIDLQTSTLDNPEVIPLQGQVQVAERIGWMTKLDTLPSHERYPQMPATE